MSILIHLDLARHQKIFLPGGAVKIVYRGKRGIIYGFLLKWTPFEPTFDIITNDYDVKTIDYFKCKEVWYTPREIAKKHSKLIEDIQSGKKIIGKISPEKRQAILDVLAEIDNLTKVP